MQSYEVFLPQRVLKKSAADRDCVYFSHVTADRYCAYLNHVYDRELNEITSWDAAAKGVAFNVACTLNANLGNHELRKAYTWRPYVPPAEEDYAILSAAETVGELMNRIAMVEFSETTIRSLASTIVVFALELDKPVHDALFAQEFHDSLAVKDETATQKYKAEKTRTPAMRAAIAEYAKLALSEMSHLECVLYSAYQKLFNLYNKVATKSEESFSSEPCDLAEHELGRLEALRVKLITDFDVAKFSYQGVCAFLQGFTLPARDGNMTYLQASHRREVSEALLNHLMQEISNVTNQRNDLIVQFASQDEPANVPADAKQIMAQKHFGNFMKMFRPPVNKPETDDDDYIGEERC